MKSPGSCLTEVLVLRGRLIPASSPPEPISWLHERSKPKRIKKSLLISQFQMVFSCLRTSDGRRGMQNVPAPHLKIEPQVNPPHTACTSPYVPRHAERRDLAKDTTHFCAEGWLHIASTSSQFPPHIPKESMKDDTDESG